MGSMARTQKSSKVTTVGDGNASQVGADGNHQDPLLLYDTIGIGFLVTENIHGDRFLGIDLILRAMLGVHWLSPPKAGHCRSNRDLANVDLRRSQCQSISSNAQRGDQLDNENTQGGSIHKSDAGKHQVDERTALRLGDLVPPFFIVSVIDTTQLMELRRSPRECSERALELDCDEEDEK